MRIIFVIFSVLFLGGCFSPHVYPSIESFSTPIDLPRNTTETAEVLKNKNFEVKIIADEDQSSTKTKAAVTAFLNENKNIRVFLVRTLYSDKKLIAVEIYYFK